MIHVLDDHEICHAADAADSAATSGPGVYVKFERLLQLLQASRRCAVHCRSQMMKVLMIQTLMIEVSLKKTATFHGLLLEPWQPVLHSCLQTLLKHYGGELQYGALGWPLLE